MTKVYHYLYYRTFEIISKTNKTSAGSSSAGFLSTLVLINILSLSFLFFRSFTIVFYSVCFFGILLSILNLKYFNTINHELVLHEFKDSKVKKIYKVLVDSYLYLSFILLFSSLDLGFYAIYYFIGIVILIKGIIYFWNL